MRSAPPQGHDRHAKDNALTARYQRLAALVWCACSQKYRIPQARSSCIDLTISAL